MAVGGETAAPSIVSRASSAATFLCTNSSAWSNRANTPEASEQAVFKTAKARAQGAGSEGRAHRGGLRHPPMSDL